MFCSQEEYRALVASVSGAVIGCPACGALHPAGGRVAECCPFTALHGEKSGIRRKLVWHRQCRVETVVPYDVLFVDSDLQDRMAWVATGCETIIGHIPANNEAGEVWLAEGLQDISL